MILNRDHFFPRARSTVFRGYMVQSQVDGVNAILDGWERLAPAGDARFLAYMLATAYHETAATMQPIAEYGEGRYRAYGAPAGPWHQVYYGRGDVQLTWLANYEKADKELHARNLLRGDDSLVETPSLAMNPDVAFAIMFYGMTDGWFTGLRLADYFNDRQTDFLNARRIINGMDCAAQIAVYAREFYAAL